MVVMVNVAEDWPAGTVTEAGTTAFEVLLVRVTVVPPDAAGPFRVTVPVALVPPLTVVGLTVTELNPTGVIVNVAVLAAVPEPAEIVAVVWVFTPEVATWNVAVVAPWATVTDAGTVALELLEFNGTTTPPEGAAAERVTVPVEEIPPTTAVGFTEIEFSVGGVSVNVAVLDTLPKVPVSVTAV